MSDYIPQALWIDIFLRLPIDSLVRSIAVCKSWYALITSSAFVSLHLNRTTTTVAKENNNSLLLLRYYEKELKKEHYLLHFDNHIFGAYKTLNFPFESFDNCFRVIGCSDGLICLSDDNYTYRRHTTILWNPSIRKTVELPLPSVTFNSHGPFGHSIGFGFVAATNDYKVVRVVNLLSDCWGVPPEVEVYELSTNSWRSVEPRSADPMCFQYIIPKRCPYAFLNGAVHWVGYDRCSNKIVSFDMETEVFCVISVPDSDHQWKQIRVAVHGESLSLIHGGSSAGKCCIWVMQQYGVHESWTNLFTIDLVGGLKGVSCFRKDGEVLMWGTDEDWWYSRSNLNLFSYDPSSKQVKNLGVYGTTDTAYFGRGIFYMDNFVESLVLLDRLSGELWWKKHSGNGVTPEGFAALFKEEDAAKGNQIDGGETEEEYK